MPTRRFDVFSAGEAAKMKTVFEQCWQRLVDAKSDLALPSNAIPTREALVLEIIELAREGKTDPQTMCAEALKRIESAARTP